MIRSNHGFFGEFVKKYPIDFLFILSLPQFLGHVPCNSFPLTVRVRRQVNGFSIFSGGFQILEDFRFSLNGDIIGFEIFLNIV